MKTTIPALIFLLSSTLARADIVYNVTFEEPPHFVGQPPVTGTGTDRPTPTANEWEIRNDIAGFASQVAYLPDWGTPGGAMGFVPSGVYASGIHSIMWDASMLSLDLTSGGLEIATMITSDGSGPIETLGIDFLNNGAITVTDISDGGFGETVGTWMPGDVFAFHAILDLDADTYDFFLNGSLVIDSQPLGADANISAVSFNRPFSTAEFALDNFRWEIVPEPSSIILLLCGGCILAGSRRRVVGA